jgi:hypothetical protein
MVFIGTTTIYFYIQFGNIQRRSLCQIMKILLIMICRSCNGRSNDSRSTNCRSTDLNPFSRNSFISTSHKLCWVLIFQLNLPHIAISRVGENTEKDQNCVWHKFFSKFTILIFDKLFFDENGQFFTQQIVLNGFGKLFIRYLVI